MLAGVGPTASILTSSGVTVGVDVEIADFPKVWGISCILERSPHEMETIWTQGFRVEVNLDLRIIQVLLIHLTGNQKDNCDGHSCQDSEFIAH